MLGALRQAHAARSEDEGLSKAGRLWCRNREEIIKHGSEMCPFCDMCLSLRSVHFHVTDLSHESTINGSSRAPW